MDEPPAISGLVQGLEVGVLGQGNLGGVGGGDREVVGPDNPETPGVGDVLDLLGETGGVDVTGKLEKKKL